MDSNKPPKGLQRVTRSQSKTEKAKNNAEPEVFVLPPNLLQKLGINLGNITAPTDSSAPDTAAGVDAAKYIPSIAVRETSSFAAQPSNAIPTKHTSILETAILMKKSVLLSPTFLSTGSHISGELEMSVGDFNNSEEVTPRVNDMKMVTEDIQPGRTQSHESTQHEVRNSVVVYSADEAQEKCIVDPSISVPNAIGGKQLNATSTIVNTIQRNVVVDDHQDEAYLSDCSNSNLSPIANSTGSLEIPVTYPQVCFQANNKEYNHSGKVTVISSETLSLSRIKELSNVNISHNFGYIPVDVNTVITKQTTNLHDIISGTSNDYLVSAIVRENNKKPKESLDLEVFDENDAAQQLIELADIAHISAEIINTESKESGLIPDPMHYCYDLEIKGTNNEKENEASSYDTSIDFMVTNLENLDENEDILDNFVKHLDSNDSGDILESIRKMQDVYSNNEMQMNEDIRTDDYSECLAVPTHKAKHEVQLTKVGDTEVAPIAYNATAIKVYASQKLSQSESDDSLQKRCVHNNDSLSQTKLDRYFTKKDKENQGASENAETTAVEIGKDKIVELATLLSQYHKAKTCTGNDDKLRSEHKDSEDLSPTHGLDTSDELQRKEYRRNIKEEPSNTFQINDSLFPPSDRPKTGTTKTYSRKNITKSQMKAIIDLEVTDNANAEIDVKNFSFCNCGDFGALAFYNNNILYKHIHFWNPRQIDCSVEDVFKIYDDYDFADVTDSSENPEWHHEDPETNSPFGICWNDQSKDLFGYLSITQMSTDKATDTPAQEEETEIRKTDIKAAEIAVEAVTKNHENDIKKPDYVADATADSNKQQAHHEEVMIVANEESDTCTTNQIQPVLQHCDDPKYDVRTNDQAIEVTDPLKFDKTMNDTKDQIMENTNSIELQCQNPELKARTEDQAVERSTKPQCDNSEEKANKQATEENEAVQKTLFSNIKEKNGNKKKIKRKLTTTKNKEKLNVCKVSDTDGAKEIPKTVPKKSTKITRTRLSSKESSSDQDISLYEIKSKMRKLSSVKDEIKSSISSDTPITYRKCKNRGLSPVNDKIKTDRSNKDTSLVSKHSKNTDIKVPNIPDEEIPMSSRRSSRSRSSLIKSQTLPHTEATPVSSTKSKKRELPPVKDQEKSDMSNQDTLSTKKPKKRDTPSKGQIKPNALDQETSISSTKSETRELSFVKDQENPLSKSTRKSKKKDFSPKEQIKPILLGLETPVSSKRESSTTEDDSISSDSRRSPIQLEKKEVKCGVCHQSIAKSQWMVHIGQQHEYLAWTDGEPQLDVSDENVVQEHLDAISKKIGVLTCSKCGFKRKSAKAYLKHSLKCEKCLSFEQDQPSRDFPAISKTYEDGVKCGVCQERVLAKDWNKHIQRYHAYMAWKDGETLDLNDEQQVYNHLYALVQEIGQLVCPKCGIARRYAKKYLTHVQSCNEVSTDAYNQDVYKCGVCSKKVNHQDWKNHRMIEHYNLAWIEGETPLDLKNPYVVERYLKEFQKHHTLTCKICRVTRASCMGFYAHVLVCGKTEEEVEEFKMLCTVCNKKYLCIYNVQHTTWHRNAELTKERKLEQEQEKLQKVNKALEDDTTAASTPGKRKAAQKAIAVIENYKTENRKYKHICPICSFGTDVEAELKQHQLNCVSNETDFSEGDSQSVSEESSSPDDCSNDPEDSDASDDSDIANSDAAAVKKRKRKYKHPHEHDRDNPKRYPRIVKDPKRFLQKSCQEFCAFHLSGKDLFPEWRAFDYEPVPEEKVSKYFAPLEQSCKVKSKGAWTTYNTFEAKEQKKDYSLFVGSSIQCLAWAPPAPEDSSNYLAIACHRSMDWPKLSPDDIASHPGIIQIWDFGTFNKIPNIALSLAHDHGTIWTLDWCPSGAQDLMDNETETMRMGLLATACSNGSAFIYSVPFPTASPLTIKLKPVVELRLSTGSTRKVYQATSLRWSPQIGHTLIVVGYSDGTTAYYDLHTDSPLLKTKENDVLVIYPYHDEQLLSACVSALDVYPSMDESSNVGAVCAGGVTGAVATRGLACSSRLYTRLSCHTAMFGPLWPSVILTSDIALGRSAATELEWGGGGRCVGGGVVACGCVRCGSLALYTAPLVRLERPHPLTLQYSWKTVGMLHTTHLKKLDDLATVIEPNSYEEVTRTYGIEFKLDKTLTLNQAQKYSEMWTQHFHLSEIASMAFCPSKNHHSRLAIATVAGILFVVQVS